MRNLTTVSVGIPAYNEGKNIQNILSDLKNQKYKNIILERIIVISDGSTDDTLSKAKKIANKKLHLISGRINLGKAQRVNQIMNISTSDILILLDADVRIFDKFFISKITKPIVRGFADMVSTEIEPEYPKNFFGRSLWLSMKLKKKLFSLYKNGQNVYSCHGPARAFRKKLYKILHFQRSEGEDMFSYFICITRKFRYAFINKTSVVYKLPNNWEDHEKQSYRFKWAINYYKNIFGNNLIESEFSIPAPIYIKGMIIGFPLIIKYPLHFLYYLLIVFKSQMMSNPNLPVLKTWEISSTKGG